MLFTCFRFKKSSQNTLSKKIDRKIDCLQSYLSMNISTGYTCVAHARFHFVFGNATDSCPICCYSCCRTSAGGCSRIGQRGKGQRSSARCSSSNRSSRKGAAREGNIWLWYAHKSGLCPSLLASSFMTCNNKSNNKPGPSQFASQRGKPVSCSPIRLAAARCNWDNVEHTPIRRRLRLWLAMTPALPFSPRQSLLHLPRNAISVSGHNFV